MVSTSPRGLEMSHVVIIGYRIHHRSRSGLWVRSFTYSVSSLEPILMPFLSLAILLRSIAVTWKQCSVCSNITIYIPDTIQSSSLLLGEQPNTCVYPYCRS